ncbi:MAG: phosphoribosyltransferase family protein [Acidilobus sp.]
MPQVRVRLLGALRERIEGRQEVYVEAESWSEALKALVRVYPQLSVAIDEMGRPRPGFLVFVDGVDCRLLPKTQQAVAIDLLPVNHGGVEFELISWDRVEDAVKKVAEKVRASSFHPDVIVSVMRGGVIPGRLLADNLGVEDIGVIEVKLYISAGQKGERPYLRQPLTLSIKDRKVLLADDVSDSGLTLQFSVQALSLYMPSEVRTATLYIKPWTKYVPDYYAEQVNKWIVFPWEINEFEREYNAPSRSS